MDIELDQIFLGLFGVTAVFLSQQKNIKYQKYACIFGLLSQPFWFYATYKAEQWGIFILCFFYAVVWIIGFKNYWIKAERYK